MRRDRAVGAFLGLAIGDAYGRPLEFLQAPAVRTHPVVVTPEAFMWTDDTHMALYLGEALLDVRGCFEVESFGHAVGRQFVRWLHDPLMPSTAPGNTCLTGARAYEQHGNWRASGVEQSDGCGAVMRICPLPMMLTGDTLTVAAEISAMVTHAHPNAREAAVAACQLLRWVLEDGHLDGDLVLDAAKKLRTDWKRGGNVAESLEAAVRLAASPSGEDLWMDEPAVPPGDGGWRSGSALGLALLAALRWKDDPATAIEQAARIDGDSDSVACLTGMFLGAAGGVDVLPQDWVAAVPRRDEITAMAVELAQGVSYC